MQCHSVLTPFTMLQAGWRLSTYLKLPWRPHIDILGETEYTLDASSSRVRRCTYLILRTHKGTEPSSVQHGSHTFTLAQFGVLLAHRWCGM